MRLPTIALTLLTAVPVILMAPIPGKLIREPLRLLKKLTILKYLMLRQSRCIMTKTNKVELQ